MKPSPPVTSARRSRKAAAEVGAGGPSRSRVPRAGERPPSDSRPARPSGARVTTAVSRPRRAGREHRGARSGAPRARRGRRGGRRRRRRGARPRVAERRGTRVPRGRGEPRPRARPTAARRRPGAPPPARAHPPSRARSLPVRRPARTPARRARPGSRELGRPPGRGGRSSGRTEGAISASAAARRPPRPRSSSPRIARQSAGRTSTDADVSQPNQRTCSWSRSRTSVCRPGDGGARTSAGTISGSARAGAPPAAASGARPGRPRLPARVEPAVGDPDRGPADSTAAARRVCRRSSTRTTTPRCSPSANGAELVDEHRRLRGTSRRWPARRASARRPRSRVATRIGRAGGRGSGDGSSARMRADRLAVGRVDRRRRARPRGPPAGSTRRSSAARRRAVPGSRPRSGAPSRAGARPG